MINTITNRHTLVSYHIFEIFDIIYAQMISKVHDTNVKFASYHDNKVASVDKDGKITISDVDCARVCFKLITTLQIYYIY